MAGNQARLSIQGATDEILRRQQAAFAKATGELDRQNAWMAIPASTPALAVLGAKAAAVLERTPLADEWGDQRHQAAEHANDVRSAYPGWVRTLANVDEAAKLVEIDWKLARDRRVWERANGRDWPRTVDGRRYHRHHYEPRADGGSEALDNYGPMDPDEHRKHHQENGDFKKWGSWSGRKPPKVSGLGWLGLIPNITGLLSGRIRTDSFDNFASDLMGAPSEEDRLKALEAQQRRLNPEWKPGDPILF